MAMRSAPIASSTRPRRRRRLLLRGPLLLTYRQVLRRHDVAPALQHAWRLDHRHDEALLRAVVEVTAVVKGGRSAIWYCAGLGAQAQASLTIDKARHSPPPCGSLVVVVEVCGAMRRVVNEACGAMRRGRGQPAAVCVRRLHGSMKSRPPRLTDVAVDEEDAGVVRHEAQLRPALRGHRDDVPAQRVGRKEALRGGPR
jgi:hypothetical protein